MSYLVIAFPEMAAGDLRSIQAYRQDHDRQYTIVAPHFTLVFATGDHSGEQFLSEVRTQSAGIKKFMFTLRSAIAHKDDFSDQYHLFLVPDEGFSELVKLHDQLYSGLFSAQLRADIYYIPHITIGNTADAVAAKKMADEWNARDFTFSGSVRKLSVIAYTAGVVTLLDEIILAP